MSNLIIIAGPNSASKTTLAPSLLQRALQINNFVNADIIAQGLCSFQPEKEALQAGLIMLKSLCELAAKKKILHLKQHLPVGHFYRSELN